MEWFVRLLGVALIATPLCFSEPPACYRKMEREFFNPDYVSQALSFHDISQSAWPEVNRVLKEHSTLIPERTRALARKQHPNPFNVPFDGEEAAKILTQVQLEVLAKTLARFNINSPYVVRQIYDYIKQQQHAQWDTCFGIEEEIKKP